MKVKATTVYDWKAYMAKSGVYSYGRLNPKVGKAVATGAFTALIAGFICAVYGISGSGDVNMKILIAILMFVFVYFLGSMFLSPRVHFNSMLKTRGLYTYNFVFKEDGFESELTPETENGRITLDYAKLAKVIETSDYIFLFVNTRNILPVDKSGIEGGRVEEVRKAVQVALGKKYKIAKY